MTNTFLANSFLPSDFDGYLKICRIFMYHHIQYKYLCRPGEYDLSSAVLVIQLNVSERVELPKNGTISMTFEVPINLMPIVKYLK